MTLSTESDCLAFDVCVRLPLSLKALCSNSLCSVPLIGQSKVMLSGDCDTDTVYLILSKRPQINRRNQRIEEFWANPWGPTAGGGRGRGKEHQSNLCDTSSSTALAVNQRKSNSIFHLFHLRQFAPVSFGEMKIFAQEVPQTKKMIPLCIFVNL